MEQQKEGTGPNLTSPSACGHSTLTAHIFREGGGGLFFGLRKGESPPPPPKKKYIKNPKVFKASETQLAGRSNTDHYIISPFFFMHVNNK